jgi:hypothetical protein
MNNGRLRIDLGTILTLVASALLAFGLSCEVEARVAIANTGNWSTVIYVGNDSAEVVTFETAPCQIAPCLTRVTIPPGGAARVETLPQGFYTLPGTPRIWSLLRFDDGVTAQSYAVPQLGAIIPGTPQTFGPLSNGGGAVVTLNLFPTQAAELTVEVIGPDGAVLATEQVIANPPVRQYEILTPFPAGTIRLSTVPCRVFPCIQDAPLYGFVAVSDRRGGNAAVWGFR